MTNKFIILIILINKTFQTIKGITMFFNKEFEKFILSEASEKRAAIGCILKGSFEDSYKIDVFPGKSIKFSRHFYKK